MEDETALAGGNASGEVVRVGSTVRKAWTPSTPAVVSFLRSLAMAGIDVPAHLGRDDAGRQVLEYVPGELAQDLPPLDLGELARVGSMVRAIHDASGGIPVDASARWESLIPAPADDLICHNDLAPWNLVVGERWVFIDWDGAAPSTRLWDLAYAAQSFCLNDPHEPLERAAERLRAFVEGYRPDRAMRTALPRVMGERADAMHALLRSAHESGREPWSAMFVAGHGEHWRTVAAYVRSHDDVWAAALA
ncbi:phosphotransferase [Microbacterium sp. NPDC057407]|uniref:phosphotransferase n=1 Tax=Microbacterium sp. NPDC057407 TaxID=3346120 RepID=UPI003671D73D